MRHVPVRLYEDFSADTARTKKMPDKERRSQTSKCCTYSEKTQPRLKRC